MPTVVVVEDDEETRNVLHLLFTDDGYSVATAHGGLRALELLRHSPSHPGHLGHAIVLFDYRMPEGDGLSLLKGVAQNEALQRRFTGICMAARERSRMPAEFTALLDRLAVPFVAKPFDVDTDVDTLLARVEAAQRRLLMRTGVRP